MNASPEKKFQLLTEFVIETTNRGDIIELIKSLKEHTESQKNYIEELQEKKCAWSEKKKEYKEFKRKHEELEELCEDLKDELNESESKRMKYKDRILHARQILGEKPRQL